MSTKTSVKIYNLISFLVCILFRMEKRSVRTFDKYIIKGLADNTLNFLIYYKYACFIFLFLTYNFNISYWSHQNSFQHLLIAIFYVYRFLLKNLRSGTFSFWKNDVNWVIKKSGQMTPWIGNAGLCMLWKYTYRIWWRPVLISNQ